MSTQAVTPEIQQWIIVQSAAGFDNQQLLESMRASGWDYESAVRAIADTLRPPLIAPTGFAQGPVSAVALPEPGLSGSATALDAGDCSVRVLLTMSSPRVVAFERFLADDECDELIELARPRLQRSETIDRDSGGTMVNAARSSSGMFFGRGENPLCVRIEQRIARLVNWPVENGEGLQILRYGAGAQYKPHYDYFDPGQPDLPAILGRGGQRVGTLIIYLSTPVRGGATIFPDATLEVAPIKGNAVFFSYDRPHPGTRSLHGGTPVLKGEKWIATKWLREGTFV